VTESGNCGPPVYRSCSTVFNPHFDDLIYLAMDNQERTADVAIRAVECTFTKETMMLSKAHHKIINITREARKHSNPTFSIAVTMMTTG
jgi:hypothetical protein